MTKYVVLRTTPPADGETLSFSWEHVLVVEATSSETAIRKCATDPGTYVAVPERSFQQQTVEIKHRDPVMTLTPLATK